MAGPLLCHITGGAAAPWGGSPEGGQGPQGGAGLGRGEPFVAGLVAPCGTQGTGCSLKGLWQVPTAFLGEVLPTGGTGGRVAAGDSAPHPAGHLGGGGRVGWGRAGAGILGITGALSGLSLPN